MKVLNLEPAAFFINKSEQNLQTQNKEKNYDIDYNMVLTAFGIEFVIASLALYGNYLLSSRYATSSSDFLVMILAPICFFFIEISRIPLAVAFRTQDTMGIKIMCLVGVLAFSTVTIKSVSQLSEMMFHPRMHAVEAARRNLTDAKAELEAYQSRIKSADDLVEQKKDQLNKARSTYDGIIEKLGSQKEQPCLSTFKMGRNGVRSKGIACPKNKIAEAISSQKDTAKSAVDMAGADLANANNERSKLFDGKYAVQLALTEKEVKSALFSSQLHSFTGMFYGKDVTHVSDDEVYAFMRLFVFIPSICVALAASILAAASVTKLPKKEEREDLALSAGEAGALIDELASAAIDRINNTDPGAKSKTAA